MDKTSQTRMLDLLDHAYRVSDDLDAFEALLENANSYFFDGSDTVQISPDLPRFADMDPHIDRHIERLGRLIATRKGEDKLGLSLDRHAQFILSAKGQVISANAEAMALAPGIEGAFLNDLPFSLDSIDALRELTREILAGVQSLDRIIHMQIETDAPTPAFGFCRAVDLRDPAKGGGAVGLRVSLSYFSWSPAIFDSLTNALGLTGSEGEVLRGVLLGHSQKDIAESRGRSLDTIKSQSKSILRKAGCSRMTDLAHLCTSISYVIGLSEKAAQDGAINEQWITPRQNMHTMERPNGRTLAWYEYGDPDGRPVLYFHGFFQGPFFLDSLKRKFLEAGLRVFAPSRPSFGYTSAADTKTPYPAMAQEDVLALIDTVVPEGELLVIAGHGGSNHAYRAVDALGGRVKAMVMVGARVPMTREHLAHMQQRARTISAACRHAPSVMKLIVTLGIKTYHERGIKAFLQNEYAPSVIDRADIAYPDRFLKLSEGMFHLMQQGGDAFVQDGRAQMSNWSDVYRRVSVPQFWIHGRHCHVMGAHLLEKYVTKTGGKITIVESAGFNILYQQPDAVMETIAKAAAL